MNRSLRGIRLVASGLVCLWTLDVLVHLGLVERLLGSDQLVSGAGFLGLLLVDAQVAAAAALAAMLGAAVLARWTQRDETAEAVALLAAALSFVSASVASGLVWGVVAGVVVWPCVRALAVRRADALAHFATSTHLVMWPVLGLGFAHRGLLHARDGQASEALVVGLLALLVLGLALAAWRMRVPGWTRLAGWLPLAGALGLAVWLSSGAFPHATRMAAEPTPAGSERPDIVLIVLDTLRADHLRSYGYAEDTMPALERWGRRALVVERAISAAGWTSPSHASIFSGRNVSAHGVHYLYRAAAGGRFWSRPVEGIDWLPQILAEQGYACFAVTANELALPEEIQGFQEVIAPRFVDWGRTVAGAFDRRLRWTLPLSERLRWRMPYVDGEQMVEIAMGAVPEDARPVFLFVNLMDAHSPYNPPARVLEEVGFRHPRIFSRYATPWEITASWKHMPEGKQAYLRDLYDAGLRWLDINLDTLLDWVDRRFGENAIVVVTSDHGELLGEQGRVGHEHGLAPALVHVPLLVRAPGVAPGRLAPPLALRNLYGFLAAAGERGRADPELLLNARPGTISERYPRDLPGDAGRAWVSLVEGEVQVIGPSADGLVASRLDGRDGAPDSAALRRMGEQIDRYWEQHRDRREPEAEAERLSRERIERLRALGYVD
jgi:hypothetical protein